jgi:hypothetical protein
LTKPEDTGARLNVAACSINCVNSARGRLLIVIVFLERRIVFLIIGHLKQTLEVHSHGTLMTNYDLRSRDGIQGAGRSMPMRILMRWPGSKPLGAS